MNNLKYWIALDRTEGIGIAALHEIYNALRKFNLSIIDLFDLSSDELSSEFSFNKKVCNGVIQAAKTLSSIEKDYFGLLDAGVSITPFFAESYPKILRMRLGNQAPAFLYSSGEKSLLEDKAAAVLGDSRISSTGERISLLASAEMVKHRITVVSGFARGADMAAHRSTLMNGGKTIALLPYGMNHVKIPENIKDVFNPEKILLISPFYPTHEPTKFNAYIRNRLVCALSGAVFIVEAPEDGGIFEAAKSAHKLGIPLFTTEYGEYPENAKGNKKILEDLGGIPVRSKLVDELRVPNMDKFISVIKFNS